MINMEGMLSIAPGVDQHKKRHKDSVYSFT
jgi:hypothetical protein